MRFTIIFLGLLLCRQAAAQFPPELLPVSQSELANTAAAKVDTTRFKADSTAKAADIDTLKQIWQWHGELAGSEITSPYPITFAIRNPSGPPDSALTDPLHLVQARHLWAMRDTTDTRIDSVIANPPASGMDSSTVRALAAQIVSDSLDADTLRSFNLSIPSTDSSYQGITKRWIAGETVTFGQVVRKGSDGKMYLADADSILTMVVVGVSVSKGSVAANGNVRILTYGYIRCDAWNWTVLGGQYPAGIVFASTTPGVFTQTAPTGATDQDQFLGYAETADVIWFAPSPISIGR
jgi:hypothetical protein